MKKQTPFLVCVFLILFLYWSFERNQETHKTIWQYEATLKANRLCEIEKSVLKQESYNEGFVEGDGQAKQNCEVALEKAKTTSFQEGHQAGSEAAAELYENRMTQQKKYYKNLLIEKDLATKDSLQVIQKELDKAQTIIEQREREAATSPFYFFSSPSRGSPVASEKLARGKSNTVDKYSNEFFINAMIFITLLICKGIWNLIVRKKKGQ